MAKSSTRVMWTNIAYNCYKLKTWWSLSVQTSVPDVGTSLRCSIVSIWTLTYSVSFFLAVEPGLLCSLNVFCLIRTNHLFPPTNFLSSHTPVPSPSYFPWLACFLTMTLFTIKDSLLPLQYFCVLLRPLVKLNQFHGYCPEPSLPILVFTQFLDSSLINNVLQRSLNHYDIWYLSWFLGLTRLFMFLTRHTIVYRSFTCLIYT